MNLRVLLIVFVVFFLATFIHRLTISAVSEQKKDRHLHKKEWFGNVDRIYVITIPSRRGHATQFCRTLGLPGLADNYIFDAVDKKDINISAFASGFVRPLNAGEVACYQSHLEVMRDIRHNNYKCCVIFEDDVVLPENYSLSFANDYISNALMESKNAFDLLYFGRCWDRCRYNQRVSDHLVKTMYPGCTHAYAITADGCQKLLRLLDRMTDSLDRSIKKLAFDQKINCLATHTNIFVQDRGAIKSELGHERERLRMCLDDRNSERS